MSGPTAVSKRMTTLIDQHEDWTIIAADVRPIPEGKTCAPDLMVWIIQGTRLASSGPYPAYRIWTLLAHWTEGLDDLAAQPADDLRERVRALADEWERLADGNEAARGRNTTVAAYYRRHAHLLRALLAPEGDPS